MMETATGAVHPECYQQRERRGNLQTLVRTGECNYQGTWRLTHSSAGPMTGRSCHPRDMTSPRIDSAVLLSRLRSTDAW
jgi:hypothetical protein